MVDQKEYAVEDFSPKFLEFEKQASSPVATGDVGIIALQTELGDLDVETALPMSPE